MSEVSLIAAFFGGLVSFASPCVLPIVPAYLSLIGGVSVGELSESTGEVRLRIVRDTALFVLGFGAIFVLLGLSITALGNTLFENRVVLTRLAGAVVIGMAVFLLLSQTLNILWIQKEQRFHPQMSRFGPFAALVAGLAFGLGWTPCIGPVLTSVLAVASTQDGVARGGLLLGIYSLGLGLPFLAAGLAFGHLTGAFLWIRRNSRKLNVLAAGVLFVFGVLLLLGRLTWVTSELQSLLRDVGLDRIVTLGTWVKS